MSVLNEIIFHLGCEGILAHAQSIGHAYWWEHVCIIVSIDIIFAFLDSVVVECGRGLCVTHNPPLPPPLLVCPVPTKVHNIILTSYAIECQGFI